MRQLLLLAALVLALPAGSRSATPPAELFVFAYDTAAGAASETDVDLSLNGSAGVVTEEVPAGYRLDLSASPGTVVGSRRSRRACSPPIRRRSRRTAARPAGTPQCGRPAH
jgi:hypothetical protein